jgi:hypothetical protein
MKKLSIILFIALVALASCTKSKEVHPEIGDGNDEIVTVGMKDVHVKYTRTDHAELSRVVFHYSLAEIQQFVSAVMTKRDTLFELTLDDLLCDALYSYYYELFYNGGETSTTERKTFCTQACDTPTPPTPPSGVPEGAVNGLFTINANGDQVYFSQGNLQYRASSNTWRFAEHQWNYVGETLIDFDGGTIQMGNVYENGVKCDNKLISSTYSGWIDLFGWGTSGWECGNTYFYPWDNTNSVSGYGPTVPSNLSGIYANCDWGMYNAISNGGNQIKLWRTMTREEWNYVFFLRSTLSGKHYAKAQIDDVYGVILLPDNWSNSVYNLIGADDNTGSIGYRHNIMTSSVWENIFQPNGAVFLPAAGERGEFPARNSGYYWSASYYDDDCMWAWHAVFEDEYVFIDDDGFGHFRHAGHSVRLVHDAQ